MKKFFAGLGIVALVALGTTFPATADSVQPVAEIVAESDAIVASPDAVLTHPEPVVTTTAADVPVEPVAAPVRAYVAPVTPVPVQRVPVVPVAPVVPVCYEEMPCWDCKRMGNLICGPVEPVKGTTPTEPVVIPPHAEPDPTAGK